MHSTHRLSVTTPVCEVSCKHSQRFACGRAQTGLEGSFVPFVLLSLGPHLEQTAKVTAKHAAGANCIHRAPVRGNLNPKP
eukprot:5433263-Amphidinium_carterae.1